jgi:hypothetical protein
MPTLTEGRGRQKRRLRRQISKGRDCCKGGSFGNREEEEKEDLITIFTHEKNNLQLTKTTPPCSS